jgi:hypothetical protein
MEEGRNHQQRRKQDHLKMETVGIHQNRPVGMLPASVRLLAEMCDSKKELLLRQCIVKDAMMTDNLTQIKAHKLLTLQLQHINIVQEYIELYRELLATILTFGHP